MNNFAYEENFYTENKETKEALKELTACHHIVHGQPADVASLQVDEAVNLRYCTLMVRLCDAVTSGRNGVVKTNQIMYWWYNGRWNDSLHYEIVVSVIDAASLWMARTFKDEMNNHNGMTTQQRDRKHQRCRQVVGLLNWLLMNVYATKGSDFTDEDFNEARVRELKTWCRAYALWNQSRRYMSVWEENKLDSAGSETENMKLLLMAVRMARTCCCILRTLEPYLKLKFKCRTIDITLNNRCRGDYIQVDNEKKTLAPVHQAEDMARRGRWCDAAFTEYIILAGQYFEQIDELGDALACYYFAKNNGRYVHLLTGKKMHNSMTINKTVKSAKDTLILLETFVVLREEMTMPGGQDPLSASTDVDNDVTQFNFVCSSDPNKLPL